MSLEALKDLHQAAGRPSLNRLKEHADRQGHRISRSALGNLLSGLGSPRVETLEAFIAACVSFAHTRRPSIVLDPALLQRVRSEHQHTRPDRPTWTRVPRQLPAAVAGFAGRNREFDLLHQLLAQMEKGEVSTVTISAVGGMAGVGKTALAVSWAHQVIHHFPDGQLYANLRGFEPSGTVPASPAEVIRSFLDAFGVPPHRVPADVNSQAALYRGLLADKRVLVILDNARNAEQMRTLLPGTSGCMALVTSRDDLTSLVAKEGAWPLHVGVLSAAEAEELLSRRLGAERVTVEPDGVRRLLSLTGCLPLALAVVAARAALRPDLSLADLATQVSGNRLSALSAGDAVTDLRTVLSWSYNALTTNAARMLRLLSIHPGPDFSSAAAASVAGVSVEQAETLLRELVQSNLVEVRQSNRFTIHDLLRAYAAELIDAKEAGEAKERQADHYLHSAREADLAVQPHEGLKLELAKPQRSVTVLSFTGAEDAMAWFAIEHPVLLAQVRHEVEEGLGRQTWQLAAAMSTALHRRGHGQDWLTTQQMGMKAAVGIGDMTGQATMARNLGYVYAELGELDEAERHLKLAISLWEATGNTAGQASAHHGLGGVCERRGDVRQAIAHAERALELSRAAGHPAGEADALNALGWCQGLMGEHELAFQACEQALAIQREIGNRDGEAAAWDSLGFAYQSMGRAEEGLGCYLRSAGIFHELGDQLYEAVALEHLGDGYQELGRTADARRSWRQALSLLEAVDYADAAELRAKLGP